MSVPKDQCVCVSCHLAPLQAPGEEHSEGLRTSSQGGRQEFKGSILVCIIPGTSFSFLTDRSVPALRGAQGTPAHGCGTALSRSAFVMLLLTPGSPLGSAGCVLGMLSRPETHLLHLGETFRTTCCRCSDKDDFIADSSQAVIYSYTHSRGRPGRCVWRVSPPAHRLQRPLDKSRDMNKGQGSLPWATKAVLENKNSTERAHKRQKILPSCHLSSPGLASGAGECKGRRYPGPRGSNKGPSAQPRPRAPSSAAPL